MIPTAIFNANEILDILAPVIAPPGRAVLNESGSLEVAFELKDALDSCWSGAVLVAHLHP